MGAFGTPEHLPNENQQEPTYQYGYGTYKSPTVPLNKSRLKLWQKILIYAFCVFSVLFGIVMLVTVGSYAGNMVYGILTASIFIASSIIFVLKTRVGNRSWPFVLCAVIAFFAYFSGYGTSTAPNVKRTANGVAPAVVTSSIPNQKVNEAGNIEKYKSECQSYKYKAIARNPNEYKGKQSKFTGKVLQVQESFGTTVLRVDVTKDEYEIWKDTIYVEYTSKGENESRILEDDIITIYGDLNGIKSYTTVLGSEVSVPYLLAKYVDILPDSPSSKSTK